MNLGDKVEFWFNHVGRPGLVVGLSKSRKQVIVLWEGGKATRELMDNLVVRWV